MQQITVPSIIVGLFIASCGLHVGVDARDYDVNRVTNETLPAGDSWHSVLLLRRLHFCVFALLLEVVRMSTCDKPKSCQVVPNDDPKSSRSH